MIDVRPAQAVKPPKIDWEEISNQIANCIKFRPYELGRLISAKLEWYVKELEKTGVEFRARTRYKKVKEFYGRLLDISGETREQINVAEIFFEKCARFVLGMEDCHNLAGEFLKSPEDYLLKAYDETRHYSTRVDITEITGQLDKEKAEEMARKLGSNLSTVQATWKSERNMARTLVETMKHGEEGAKVQAAYWVDERTLRQCNERELNIVLPQMLRSVTNKREFIETMRVLRLILDHTTDTGNDFRILSYVRLDDVKYGIKQLTSQYSGVLTEAQMRELKEVLTKLYSHVFDAEVNGKRVVRLGGGVLSQGLPKPPVNQTYRTERRVFA